MATRSPCSACSPTWWTTRSSMAGRRTTTGALPTGARGGGAARPGRGAAVGEIADPGPGLSPDELGRVFQPFYRTDASRNLDTGGVGLGLPIARSTARAHGGDVELRSRPGGTTAIVTLPAAA